jgi:hypothetical protein
MIRLTASSLATLRKCPRQYHLRYNMGLIRLDERKEFRFGRAFHKGMELLMLGFERNDAIADATDSIADDVERETARNLLAGHAWRYEQDRLQPLVNADDQPTVEQMFEIPLVNPETGASSRTFCLAGKIDAIVSGSDGRPAVLEYKTAGEDIGPDGRYWLKLRIDPQISLYFLAAEALGHAPQTILYDVTRKPTISPKQIPILDAAGNKVVLDKQTGERVLNKNGTPKQAVSDSETQILQTRTETAEEFGARLLNDIGERPDYYLARREVPRLQDELDEFRAELWQEGQTLLHRMNKGLWPRTGVNTRSCDYCQYADLCLQRIGVDPANPPQGYEVLADVHPELAQETTPATAQA